MIETPSYVPDQREFSSCTLENGLKCYFIRDSSVGNVNVSLTVTTDSSELPAELIGLNSIAMGSIWRGSEKYPGTKNFRDFVDENEIKFKHLSANEVQSMLAEGVPKHAVEEYLDRVADMITNPEITKEGIDYAEMRYGDSFYDYMKDDYFRSLRIAVDIFLPDSSCMLQLFNRKDLVYRVRDFIYRNYCPSKMTLLLSGDMPMEKLRQLAVKCFDWVPRNSPRIIHTSPRRSVCFSSDENSITFARGYTRNETKRLTVKFRIPRRVKNSSLMFIAYLLNTSKLGSLQHRLKCEGLINEIYAENDICAENLRTLSINISQTSKGSQNSMRILGLLMGYIELIKQMEVSGDLFKEAHDFYVCLWKEDNAIGELNRMYGELYADAVAEDLRYSEIPHDFNRAEIRFCAECLVPKNCVAVALSNEHRGAPVMDNTDYYLQYFTDEVKIEPCYDGLAVGNLDPLIAGCRMPLVEDSDLHLISPNVYLRSIAGEFSSTVNIGVKSAEFSKYPLLAQKLYGQLINHKLSLVTNRLFDISVNVDAESLNVCIKCPPESVSRIMFLVCGYLSKPFEDATFEKFTELKQEKERILDMWLSGEFETAYQPEFDEILKDDVDPVVQKQQLQAIKTLADLPQKIKGEVVLLFGGNAHPALAFEAARTAICLYSNRPEACSVTPTSRDTKRTIPRKYFKTSSICKVFDAGPFSHSNWVSLTLIRRILTELFSNGILIGPRTSSEFTAESSRRGGRMWLTLRLSGDAPELELERRLDRCVSEDLMELLECADEDLVADFRNVVWEKDLITPKRDTGEEEMSFLWRIVKESPQADTYFGEMRTALLEISVAAVRKFYTLYLSRERCYGTRTFVWKPRGNRDDFSGLELGALGVYRPLRSSGDDEPSSKRLRKSNLGTELSEMIMKTNDIMDMLGLNDGVDDSE